MHGLCSCVLFVCFVLLPSAHAAAPSVRTQAPGYYRWMLGTLEVTALSDGTFDLDTSAMLRHADRLPLGDLFDLEPDGKSIVVSVNAYLVNTGRRLVLLDAGAADLFGPTLGRLMSSLRASGYEPGQVDDILITHMHPDHVGGLLVDGQRAFPNAVLHVARSEVLYWIGGPPESYAAAAFAPFFGEAAAAIKPYVDAGAFEPFDAPATLMEGFQATPTPGHTPGHTIYSVESGGQRLVFWGDLVEFPSIQFDHPEVTIAFDVDEPSVAAVRSTAYAEAAAGRYWLAVSHFSFPGIGHIRADRSAYEWIPVSYDRVR